MDDQADPPFGFLSAAALQPTWCDHCASPQQLVDIEPSSKHQCREESSLDEPDRKADSDERPEEIVVTTTVENLASNKVDNTKTLVSVDDDKKVDLAENLVGKSEVKAEKLGDDEATSTHI